MVENNNEWLRGRGIGRERLAGHIGDFLEGNGFKVEKAESAEPPETLVRSELAKMNPAVPTSGRRMSFRITPTSGGCAIWWLEPLSVTDGDRPRVDRFVRELFQHVERAVLTESHGTAKLTRAPGSHLPWEPPVAPR
jgi:hypothetical protein